MEKEPQLPTHSTIEQQEEDEEFYENMEAPKFVDLTLQDPFRPDDRYWFCLRVGNFHFNHFKKKNHIFWVFLVVGLIICY